MWRTGRGLSVFFFVLVYLTSEYLHVWRNTIMHGWPYINSSYLMQSNGGSWTMLMKPTAIQRGSPAWANKHLLLSWKEKQAGQEIHTYIFQSVVLISLCITVLTRKITCIHSGNEGRPIISMRNSLKRQNSFKLAKGQMLFPFYLINLIYLIVYSNKYPHSLHVLLGIFGTIWFYYVYFFVCCTATDV